MSPVARKGSGDAVLGALGLGAVAGIRSMTPPALLSRAASRGEVPGIEETPFAFLASKRAARLLTVLALGEISADKLPFAPDRTSIPGLAGRLATGALVGAALYAADGRGGTAGGALGALSSLGREAVDVSAQQVRMADHAPLPRRRALQSRCAIRAFSARFSHLVRHAARCCSRACEGSRRRCAGSVTTLFG